MVRAALTHLRGQWMGALALFLVIAGGTAFAANTVFSSDIVNGEVKSVDIGNNQVAAADLGPDSVGLDALDPAAFAAPDIAPTAAGGTYEIADNAVQGGEVTDDVLTGADVRESTLTALDAHETGYSTCDPHDVTFIDCAEITFTLGRPMPVLGTWTYGFGTDGGDPPGGVCRITVDGGSGVRVNLQTEDDSDYSLGGIPVSDVFNLGAGSHTLGFQCLEAGPSFADIVIKNLHIAAIELGFD
jgi:hypothetical protein